MSKKRVGLSLQGFLSVFSFLLTVFGSLGFLNGCGGAPAAPAIAVSVTPTSATLIGGGTQTFTATVTNDSANAGVTWAATIGTITSAGVYAAPAVITATSATVTATSKTDTTKSATATIALTPISVTITTTPVAMIGGATQTFAATVAADGANAGVTWTASTGTITSAGVYTAPAVISTTSASITATSKTDPTKSASVTITLTPISVGAISPGTITLNGAGTQAFAVTVSNDGSSSGVTWSIGAGVGTLTNVTTTSATYNAPAVIAGNVPVTVSLVATSIKDPTKSSAAAIITLNPIAVTITTNTTGITLDSGQTMSIAALVANDSSASGVTFSTTGAGTVAPTSPTGNTPSTTLTATGTVASSVTVTAASTKDPTKIASTSAITVNPALTITTPAGALTAATTNSTYAGATIATSGGTGVKTFAIASGSLPATLTLNSATGAITGSITGGAATYTFTVKVTDSATTPVAVTSGTYTITVTATPLVWTSPTTGPAAYTVGTAIAPITLSATGGTGAITYSLNSGTLPAGLTLSGGVLSGTPTTATVVAGNAVTFKATDSATPTPATVTSPAITLIVNPVTLAITTTSLPTGYVGVAYNTSGFQMTSTGGTAPIIWSMSPTTVGGGVTMSTSGLLSGTPTTTYASNVTITATDSSTNQQQTKNVTLPLTVTNALVVTTTQASLPNAFVGSVYNSTGLQLAAAGGSGTGYVWSVTAGATGTNSLASLGLSVSTGGLITGTPTSSGTANFTVQVKDSASNTASASFTITAYSVLTLPAPNPSTLGSATTNQSYTGAINATGGVPPYTWTVNSTAVPTTGTLMALSDGLSVSNTGTGLLSVSGTPTSVATVSFTASIKDSTNATAGPFTYTIAVQTTSSVTGQLNMTNYCSGTPTFPGITLTLTQGSTTIQTTTASSSGSFTFTNIPNGTYTVTPSYTATGASFISYPATQNVTINGSNTSTSFSITLGYTVSGTVSYTGGAQTGQIYLSMNNNNCGGGTPGTSISAAGNYTIRGVPPGTYTLTAFMDTVGKGVLNAADPAGTGSSVTISTASYNGANVTITSPGTVTLPAAPALKGVVPFNTGAFAAYNPIENSNGVEMATSYTLQWSTTSTFTAIAGSKTFPAVGTNGANVWFINGLTNGTAYYFRAYGTSAGTAATSYSSTVGPVTIGALTTGSTVSGSVTFTAPAGGITGPMYAGLYNQSTGVFYGEYIATPVSAQAYSVVVPTSTTAVYEPVALIDQNNAGVIEAGDLQNTNNNSGSSLMAITGNTTGVNQTLPSTNGIATVTTQNYESISSGGTSQSYNLNFQVNYLEKLPVSVTLEPNSPLLSDGANVLGPIDIASCAANSNGCGQGFQINVGLGSVSPTINDTYTFNVTYSDGSTGTLTATVSNVLGATAFATNLAPQTGTSTSTTPTFTWSYPSNPPSGATYSFQLSASNGGTIWQIPGNNSNSNGFPSSQIPMPSGLVWDTVGDSADGDSPANITSLTLGTNYSWQLTTEDSNGNQATVQVNYQP